MKHRLIGLAELAVAFAQAEHGRCGNLAVLVEFRRQRLVAGDGGGEVAIGFLLEQALLQQRGQVIGGGRER
jgi:hypothetical protein